MIETNAFILKIWTVCETPVSDLKSLEQDSISQVWSLFWGGV